MALFEDIVAKFNISMEKLESFLNSNTAQDQSCQICPEDGCIFIDFGRCNNFEVLVTEDITCMRFTGEGSPGRIDFVIPPNTTRHICGFPGQAVEGNECNEDLTGGDKGKTFSFGHTGRAGAGSGLGSDGEGTEGMPNTGGNTAGGVGGAGCADCVSEDGLLRVVCCDSECEIDCNNGDTSSLKFIACGGKPPYSWSTTAGSITESGDDNIVATLTPPANTGSGVAGVAYKRCGKNDPDCAGTGLCVRVEFGCDGVQDGSCSFGTSSAVCCGAFADAEVVGCGLSQAELCTLVENGSGEVEDTRSQTMIDNGCNPCAVAVDQTVITVTDALGVSVSTIVEAKGDG